jgi:hypothetical protein
MWKTLKIYIDGKNKSNKKETKTKPNIRFDHAFHSGLVA